MIDSAKKMLLLLLVLLQLVALGLGQGSRQEWEANNYPNPTADGYQRCNMKSPSSVCDPDSVLTEAQRYRINYELNQLESRTRQLNGQSFCEKKGIVGAIAIAKHVRGGTENAVKMMANDILRKWTLDKQCSKSLVIVVATEDKKFWVARDSRVPVYAAEFTEIFNQQKPLFKDGDYPQALLNIIEGIWNSAISKQGQATPDSKGTPFQPSPGDGRRDKGKGSSTPFKMPSIPWFWILLVLLVIIPMICCCCCLYFCCCRKRGDGGTARRQGPSDLPDEEGYGARGPPPRRGFGGGGGMQNILGGIGAGAIGNTVTNWFRNRNAGRQQPAPGGATDPTPYSPPVPGGHQAKGGRGLYPSTEVKDEGGGGAW